MTAYNYVQCKVNWQTNITAWLDDDYRVIPDSFQVENTEPLSRASAQMDGDVLFIGTHRFALLLALDLESGTTLAHQQVHPHLFAIITMSPHVL
ncbi:hypothetical protein EJ03DRAFT_331570 [Teratosphaeria nubilosa]|uniref:Cleavage/polyadenylation specificity factor A subunit N-terminal domain-containing protein n=1 Tax=Teratosphaeria nubilosa TaxID=161662 RepID=A0A6G1KWU2_9PEZI|nr:hypothetical protein EJ03DRAFT_331570 [Teratosphaeria nubilosa]